jgi:hypothetical protein
LSIFPLGSIILLTPEYRDAFFSLLPGINMLSKRKKRESASGIQEVFNLAGNHLRYPVRQAKRAGIQGLYRLLQK